MAAQKIVDAVILPPEKFGDTAKVYVQFDGGEDGVLRQLFDYFDDEISFTRKELIGLTRDEVMELRHKKDLAQLRS